jgi:hypothetical protein
MVQIILGRIRGIRAFMALVALASPWRRVVVGIPEAEVARLDLERGPFVPASPGGSHSAVAGFSCRASVLAS